MDWFWAICSNIGANLVGVWCGLAEFTTSMCSVRQGLSLALLVRRTVSQGRGELLWHYWWYWWCDSYSVYRAVLGEYAQSVRTSVVVRLTSV